MVEKSYFHFKSNFTMFLICFCVASQFIGFLNYFVSRMLVFFLDLKDPKYPLYKVNFFQELGLEWFVLFLGTVIISYLTFLCVYRVQKKKLILKLIFIGFVSQNIILFNNIHFGFLGFSIVVMIVHSLYLFIKKPLKTDF